MIVNTEIKYTAKKKKNTKKTYAKNDAKQNAYEDDAQEDHARHDLLQTLHLIFVSFHLFNNNFDFRHAEVSVAVRIILFDVLGHLVCAVQPRVVLGHGLLSLEPGFCGLEGANVERLVGGAYLHCAVSGRHVGVGIRKSFCSDKKKKGDKKLIFIYCKANEHIERTVAWCARVCYQNKHTLDRQER